MNAIMIQNLKKNYGSFEVSLPRLDLRQGYVTGLVGKNGSGKTTLIRSVLGVIPKTAGTVQVLGGDITADPAIREQVGFVSETPYYIPTLTTEMVHEMVRPFYPRWDEELYQKMRAEFELPDRKIKELSKGQQKILSFLMAFCCRPRLLILDEPTANLDPSVRHRLLGYLRRYMEDEGNTILYSTHITGDLEDICDYLVGLDHGTLAFQGEKDEVLDRFRMVQGPGERSPPKPGDSSWAGNSRHWALPLSPTVRRKPKPCWDRRPATAVPPLKNSLSIGEGMYSETYDIQSPAPGMAAVQEFRTDLALDLGSLPGHVSSAGYGSRLCGRFPAYYHGLQRHLFRQADR